MKVHVGNDEHIHVKIFKPLPHTQAPPEVSEVHEHKAQHDEL